LFVRDRGIDGIFGTADDVERVASTTHAMHVNNNIFEFFGTAMDVDDVSLVWAGKQAAGFEHRAVARSAGADGTIGTADDCEIEIAGVAPSPGYTQCGAWRSRAWAFQQCTAADCGSTATPLFVREVTGGDPCTGTAPV